MSEYMNEPSNELEQLLQHVRNLQYDIETLFKQKEQKKQALLNACKAKKNHVLASDGMSLEEARKNLETQRKRYQAAIRASETAKNQMKQAERMYKKASNVFKRSTTECTRQEQETVKRISKEFSNQIKDKQKELRALEHKIKTATQKPT